MPLRRTKNNSSTKLSISYSSENYRIRRLFLSRRHSLSILGIIVISIMLCTTGAYSVDGHNPYPYKTDCAPCKVKTVTNLKLHDTSRNRDIPITIYYPEAPGPFPVIIFSHGGGGSQRGYKYLGTYWAAQGYVSIHPTHYGSDTSMLTPGRTIENLKAIRTMLNNSSNYVNRPRDVSFILDSAKTIEKNIPALAGRIDWSGIGVAGHSFGAYTTIALAGAKVDLPDKKDYSFADKRIKAFIAMSPQGPGRMGFDNNSWRGIKEPVMIMTGTEDEMPGGEKASRRLIPYQSMPPGDKYLLNLTNGNHFTFSGGIRAQQASPPHLEMIKSFSLAMWDTYLKNNSRAKKYLKENSSGKISPKDATFQSK